MYPIEKNVANETMDKISQMILWCKEFAMFFIFVRFNACPVKKNIYIAKLLQKSEMRKDIVIELSYKGFS